LYDFKTAGLIQIHSCIIQTKAGIFATAKAKAPASWTHFTSELTYEQGCQILQGIWHVFVQLMANFWQKILNIAMLMAVLIFRCFMFLAIHNLSILFNFQSLTIRKKICFNADQVSYSVGKKKLP